MPAPLQLPPYDPQAQCEKCGNDGIDTSHHQVSAPVSLAAFYSGDPCAGRGYGEHICRTCRSCGYTWPEATLDAPAPALPAGVTSLKSRKGDKT